MAKKERNNKRNNITHVSVWRFRLVVGLFSFALLLLVGRVLSLQVLHTDRGYEFLQTQGYVRAVQTESIPGYRGKILDRNGEPLAVSTPVHTIGLNTEAFTRYLLDLDEREQNTRQKIIEKKQALVLLEGPEADIGFFASLANTFKRKPPRSAQIQVLQQDITELTQALSVLAAKPRLETLAKAVGLEFSILHEKLKSGKSFVYLKRHMPPQEADSVMALRVGGVERRREYRRFYPAGEVAAHLVGYTDIDGVGREGLELAYEQWLHGEEGSVTVLKDLLGNSIREIDAGKASTPGKDLNLSIDIRLQYQAYRELKAAMQRYSASSGSVVSLDAKTGEVLALVNQPSYNPNNRRKLDMASVRNRAITDVIEPGSTTKPFTIVAALESGKYTPKTLIDTSPGYLRLAGKTFLDPVNYGVVDVATVVKKSSQVGTSKIALSLQPQSVWEVFHRFGLGSSTGSGFPGESNGALPNRSKWHDVERCNFAFGYGLSVTPLQLARAYSVFANEGKAAPVSLLRQNNQPKFEQVIAPEIAGQLLSILETVTEKGGTGTQAQVDSYRTAGKTGTVHKLSGTGYAEDRYRALFAGFAPASNPRVVTVVVINEPDIAHYHGGQSAAPVFSSITAAALRILNIAPDNIIKNGYVDVEGNVDKKNNVTQKGGKAISRVLEAPKRSNGIKGVATS